MIKVQNNTPTREPIPAFLVGLKPESLADLSWTDPALGVQDCAWWPEVDQSPALNEYQRYGAETLTLGDGVVYSVKAVVPWTAEEIAADIKSKVPQSITMRQARLALLGAGMLDDVSTAINSLPEPDKSAALIEWEYASEVQRSTGLVASMGAALGLTEAQLDELFMQAAQL